jgi:sulfur relay (sulfurtransferase) DsrC/TusE family protein
MGTIKKKTRGLDGPFGHLQGRIEHGAAAEGLGPLTADHWAVIRFVLEHRAMHGEPPIAVRIGRGTGLGARELARLFPAGVVKTVYRLAGLELPHDLAGPAPPVQWN